MSKKKRKKKSWSADGIDIETIIIAGQKQRTAACVLRLGAGAGWGAPANRQRLQRQTRLGKSGSTCVCCVCGACVWLCICLVILSFLFCRRSKCNYFISYHDNKRPVCSCVCVCLRPVTFKLRLGNCFAASSSSLSSEPEPESWTASSTLSLRLPTWTMDTQQNYEARVENKTIWITRNGPRPPAHRDPPSLYTSQTTCEVVAWLTHPHPLPSVLCPALRVNSFSRSAWAPFWASAGATITWKLTQLDFCCAHFPATVHAHVTC